MYSTVRLYFVFTLKHFPLCLVYVYLFLSFSSSKAVIVVGICCGTLKMFFWKSKGS